MDDGKAQEVAVGETVVTTAGTTTQQVDVDALVEEMQGLRNQRNSAFDDAANIFGKLQKVTKMFNSLYAAYVALKNKYEPAAVPLTDGPALKDPVPPSSVSVKA